MNPRMALLLEHPLFLLGEQKLQPLVHTPGVIAGERLIDEGQVIEAGKAGDGDRVRPAPRTVLCLILGEPIEPSGSGRGQPWPDRRVEPCPEPGLGRSWPDTPSEAQRESITCS